MLQFNHFTEDLPEDEKQLVSDFIQHDLGGSVSCDNREKRTLAHSFRSYGKLHFRSKLLFVYDIIILASLKLDVKP